MKIFVNEIFLYNVFEILCKLYSSGLSPLELATFQVPSSQL